MVRRPECSRRAAVRATALTAAAPLVAGCLGGGGGDGDGGNDGGTTEREESPAVETSFEDGKAGWTAVDLVPHDGNSDPDWSRVQGKLDMRHESAGGVDDSGHVRRTDSTSGAFFFTAPDAYLGDASAFAGGELRFALSSSHNDYRKDSAVVLQGPETVVATKFDAPGSEWTEYVVALDADARTYRESNLAGAAVGQGTLEGALADLQALRISGEHSGQVQEEVGLDEVRLRNP